MKFKKTLMIGGQKIPLNTVLDVPIKISESYTGLSESMRVRVIRGEEPGPTVFLTGAVHGDEHAGIGIIREIMLKKLKLKRGSLICIPIVNIFGFENHTRYLPDRRDLNRNFPGDPKGSMAVRLANVLYKEIICKSHVGIDFHSATIRRTNFPHVRADLRNPEVSRLAHSFGCELIVDGAGPDHSLRSEANKAGCATILYEAGESYKCEPAITALGVRGAMNVLKSLSMLPGKMIKPAYQTGIQKTQWLRADMGGMLHFHVKPGDLVRKGAKVATCEKLFSHKSDAIRAPKDGVILGMTTLPAVKPGEPVCHLAMPDKSLADIETEIEASSKTLHRRAQDELATSFKVVESETK